MDDIKRPAEYDNAEDAVTALLRGYGCFIGEPIPRSQCAKRAVAQGMTVDVVDSLDRYFQEKEARGNLDDLAAYVVSVVRDPERWREKSGDAEFQKAAREARRQDVSHEGRTNQAWQELAPCFDRAGNEILEPETEVKQAARRVAYHCVELGWDVEAAAEYDELELERATEMLAAATGEAEYGPLGIPAAEFQYVPQAKRPEKYRYQWWKDHSDEPLPKDDGDLSNLAHHPEVAPLLTDLRLLPPF
jgi:hypothetical protein